MVNPKSLVLLCLLAILAMGHLAASPASLHITRCGAASDLSNIAIQWKQTFGGPNGEIAWNALSMTDGGFLLIADTASYGAGLGDLWVLKISSDGTALWNQTYGGPQIDTATAAFLTDDGGRVLVGSTSSFGAGGRDFWVVKTDSEGVPQWNHTYGGAQDEIARSALSTADGGYLLVGDTQSFVPGSGSYVPSNAWLVKIDAQGQHQWNQSLGGGAMDAAYSAIPTADAGFLILGTTLTLNTTFQAVWVIKIDSEGVPQWNQTYGGLQSSDEGYHLVPTADGNFLLVGMTIPRAPDAPPNIGDMLAIKITANGTALWNQTYGGPESEVCEAALPLPDGGYLLAGSTSSYSDDPGDIWLVKTDSMGLTQWTATVDGTHGEHCHSILPAGEEEFLLVGDTGETNADIFVVKITLSTGAVEEDAFGLTLLPLMATLFSLSLWVRQRKKRSTRHSTYMG